MAFLVIVHPADLPGGIIRTLLTLWDIVRVTYFNILSFFTESTFGGLVEGGLITLFLGSGLTMFIGWRVVSFFLKK